MADSKVFRLLDEVTVEMVGDAVVLFLREQKNLVTESEKTTEGYLIQAKEDGDTWKAISGTTSAIKVQMLVAGDILTVNIGSGKWSDKIGAGVAGAFIFAPLLVTSAIGAIRQKKLPDEIFDFIERFIMSGGKTALYGMGVVKTLEENQLECPKCKTINNKGMKFCKECGTKLTNECPNCHNMVDFGVKFCPECGGSLQSNVTVCYNCGTEVENGQKFCSECGAKMNP